MSYVYINQQPTLHNPIPMTIQQYVVSSPFP